jgi:hypothetical protein
MDAGSISPNAGKEGIVCVIRLYLCTTLHSPTSSGYEGLHSMGSVSGAGQRLGTVIIAHSRSQPHDTGSCGRHRYRNFCQDQPVRGASSARTQVAPSSRLTLEGSYPRWPPTPNRRSQQLHRFEHASPRPGVPGSIRVRCPTQAGSGCPCRQRPPARDRCRKL